MENDEETEEGIQINDYIIYPGKRIENQGLVSDYLAINRNNTINFILYFEL